MDVTAYDLALRFVGLTEVPGVISNPQILAMLRLDQIWPENDEVPWCSAFANYIAWLLRLPRSKSLTARSWLEVGKVVGIHDASCGNDVIILARPLGGPTAGHVGFFAIFEGDFVWILGGNQGDQVSLAQFPISRIIGVRRLA